MNGGENKHDHGYNEDDIERFQVLDETEKVFTESLKRVAPSVEAVWRGLLHENYQFPRFRYIVFAIEEGTEDFYPTANHYAAVNNPNEMVVSFNPPIWGLEESSKLLDVDLMHPNDAEYLTFSDFYTRVALARELQMVLFWRLSSSDSNDNQLIDGDIESAISRDYLRGIAEQLIDTESLNEVANRYDSDARKEGILRTNKLGLAPMLDVLDNGKRESDINQIVDINIDRIAFGIAYASLNYSTNQHDEFEPIDSTEDAPQLIKYEDGEEVKRVRALFLKKLQGEHTNLQVEYDELNSSGRSIQRQTVEMIVRSVTKYKKFPEVTADTEPDHLHATKFPSYLFAGAFPLELHQIKDMFSL